MTNTIKDPVKVGQFYFDMDPRTEPRWLEVISVVDNAVESSTLCKVYKKLDEHDHPTVMWNQNKTIHRKVFVRINRLQSRYYQLVEKLGDVPEKRQRKIRDTDRIQR